MGDQHQDDKDLKSIAVITADGYEPLLPLSLFRIHAIAVGSALGFVTGFALFGAVTFLPSYLQVVKGATPTGSGLRMIALMGGLLATSIVTGQLVSRHGRYRVFPIIGTALMAVGLALCSTLGVDTPMWLASLFMLVLGAGIGAVMPILTLVAQNAVERRHLGVATSSATLFRQVGGSIGVSIFGAIFANRLATELAHGLPAGAETPSTDPRAIQALPPAIHDAYVAAFAAALHPVFLVAAGVALLSFGLSFFLREVPLRDTSHAAAQRAPAAQTYSSWACAVRCSSTRQPARARLTPCGRSRLGCGTGRHATSTSGWTSARTASLPNAC